MRHLINIISEAEHRPQTPESHPQQAPTPLLVLVHPGSACGSAEFNLGRYEARACRDGLVSELNGWRGGIVVVDADLSEELPEYPEYNSAINGCLARAKSQGFVSARVFADDGTPNWTQKAGKFIRNLVPKGTYTTITGAWYFPNDLAGCINGVYDELTGYCDCDVSDMALVDPGGREDEDYEDEYES